MPARFHADLLGFLRAACTHSSHAGQELPALPFYVREHVVGWLRPSFADQLRRWPHVFEVDNAFVTLRAQPDTAAGRSAAMAQVTEKELARDGVIRGWRDELVSVAPYYGAPELLRVERAATRHFGLMAYATHLNGFTRVGGLAHAWIARRGPAKAIDAGKLDNLVGGRISAGMSVDETLRKEAWEEAGITPALLAGVNCLGAVRTEYSVPEGLHRETMFVHDLWLPEDFKPANQDGEVSEILRMPVEEVVERILADEFTLDAGTVMIDGLLRLGAVLPEIRQYLELLDEAVTGLALGLVLAASALVHASWNYLLKKSGGGPGLITAAASLSLVVYAPLVAVLLAVQGYQFTPMHAALAFGSGMIHTAYFLLLDRAYRSGGDLSIVYPLARATGPLLTILVAILFLGERPGALALCGAFLIGVSAMVLTGNPLAGSRRDARGAVAFALATGCMISAYTVWDKASVALYLIPPLLYDWACNLFRVIVLAPWTHRRSPGAITRAWREQRTAVVAIAVLSPLSYILVLTAMVFTPVSLVAPAREVSILFAALMGAHLLREGDVMRRALAATGMALGVAGLALG